MREKIYSFLNEVETFIAQSKEETEQFRINYLGKKGKLNDLFTDFKNVIPEDRKEVGILLNTLKNKIQDKIEEFKDKYEQNSINVDSSIDLTRPVASIETGSRHPLTIVRNEIINALFIVVFKNHSF